MQGLSDLGDGAVLAIPNLQEGRDSPQRRVVTGFRHRLDIGDCPVKGGFEAHSHGQEGPLLPGAQRLDARQLRECRAPLQLDEVVA